MAIVIKKVDSIFRQIHRGVIDITNHTYWTCLSRQAAKGNVEQAAATLVHRGSSLIDPCWLMVEILAKQTQ
jgi:hypothetical protein